jgi:translation initiation factor IF-2
MEKNQTTIPKPPVVVILGHIDSGKTSLLNAILGLPFTESKPGGTITQEVFLAEIEKDGKKITFIDTPGHEAFLKMRARGAKVADIALLVIDGCEGIKEQTKEAISHIKETKLPLIVAINKVDKIQANPAKIKQELQKEGILVEEFGGKVPVVETSAKAKVGIDELLDLILLLSEMENLKTDLKAPAEGVIIESFLDPKRGPLISGIVERGILKMGDFIATSSAYGKVKRLENFQKKPINEVFPSSPFFLLGLNKVPEVGEKFFTFPDLESAKEYAEKETKKEKEVQIIESKERVLNLIIKAESLGTLEAIVEILKNIKTKVGKINILKTGVGEITENDVEMAKLAKGVILGFKTKPNLAAKESAKNNKIKILTFEVIYDLIENVKTLLEKLEKKSEIVEIGKVKVLVEFWQEKNRQIIGGRVIEGKIERGSYIEIEREGNKIGKGKLLNLQKNRRDIDKAEKGEEIGILYEGDTTIQKGDILIFWKIEKQ